MIISNNDCVCNGTVSDTALSHDVSDIHYYVSYIFQGVLAEMEEQIKFLQLQLDSRESTVTELVGRISSLEASNQTANLKIGNNLAVQLLVGALFWHNNTKGRLVNAVCLLCRKFGTRAVGYSGRTSAS